MGRPSDLTLAARFIFPVEEPPIEHGWITIADGRIAYVGPPRGASPDLDLGNVAITPGFVNAHTHLELGSLSGSASESGGPEDQVEWLKRMIGWRRESDLGSLRSNIAENIKASTRFGTTTVADITTEGLSWEMVVDAPLRGVVFTEILGLKRARGLETTQKAWEWLAKVGPEVPESNARVRPGISPHAPYSTAGWLYQRAAISHFPLTTHLAEMPEEDELLSTGEGPLRDFLSDIGAWPGDWEPIGARPADYVRKGDLRTADWLIAHGNYLQESDYWQLRRQAAPLGQRVAIAYCPRTHARFGHTPHPFRQMMQRDIIVCLGTDSLATSPTLSILDEMRFLHEKAPDVSGSLLVAMGTIFGAWALRLEDICGSLRVGKSADLAIIPLNDLDSNDPHQLLLQGGEAVNATMFAGEFVHGPWRL